MKLVAVVMERVMNENNWRISTADEPKLKEREGYSSIAAIDPRDGKEWQILVSGRLLEMVAKHGRGKTAELAYVVRPSLTKIRAIFVGIRDIDRGVCEDSWYCYVATPNRAYDYKTGEQVPAWKGEVLTIYVTNERVLYNWYWCACDGADPSLPLDWQTRFMERVL